MLRYAIVAVLLLGLGFAPVFAPVRAQDADADIQAVISGQIAAFEVDDFATAFSFASPNIKRLFGSPARFGEMVRSGYPMVWRPGEVRFAGLDTRDGRTIQSVLVTDQAGTVHVVEYEMVPVEGGWRINGVTLRRSGDAGA